MPVLSIVIPAYNEGPTIHFMLDKVLNVQLPNGWTKEVIIVNDCSKDDTEAAIQAWAAGHPALPIRYHAHPVNQGKVRRCIQASPRQQETTSSFKTPTWSTILKSTIYCCNPSWPAKRTSCTDRASWAATRTASCFSGIR